eukprot:scaffold3704_cov202-Prasinococcus_capsulatus_cf.AAC.1
MYSTGDPHTCTPQDTPATTPWEGPGPGPGKREAGQAWPGPVWSGGGGARRDTPLSLARARTGPRGGSSTCGIKGCAGRYVRAPSPTNPTSP